MRKKINHRIRYSEKDYVEKNYMKDGKAVIPIKVNKLDDLYMKHNYIIYPQQRVFQLPFRT